MEFSVAQNATYLFIEPSREFRNAESWWTALFSMTLLWETAQGRAFALPWYTADSEGNLSLSGEVRFDGATYSKVVVGGRLRGKEFGIENWPGQFFDLRPDVVIFDGNGKKNVKFVEVKTVGASVAGNILTYSGLAGFLRAEGWEAEVYYLLSVGHEADKTDWPKLHEHESRVIKWEDSLRHIAATPFSELFEFDLLDYCES
jgi:hypothetical protein